MSSITKLAVFGNPIAHSLSPLIHEHFAKTCGHEVSYERILVDGPFSQCAEAFFASGATGCNITVPCKLEAYEFANQLTERAQIAKAVNTIKKLTDEQGKVTYLGDNTDGFGLYTDLVRLNCPLKGAKVLILGAGGATHGIVPPLASQSAGLRKLTIANRTVSKAQHIIDDVKKELKDINNGLVLNACAYSDLSDADEFDVLINATSLSINKELPAIPESFYKKAQFAYDLYYSKEGSTVFTEHARSLGVQASYDGLGMLVSQAALAYELWMGVRPDIKDTLEYMREVLAKRQKLTKALLSLFGGAFIFLNAAQFQRLALN